MTDATDSVEVPLTSSATHVVYSVLRFLRVVKHRRGVVFTALVVTCLLGAIYYATAERVYQGKSSLLILDAKAEVWNENGTPEASRQSRLATFERAFYFADVLDGAIASLSELPAPEARIDLAPLPREKWRDELRERLTAKAIRSTDIIEIGYLSGNPNSAVTVVNAIVGSYAKYIEDTHRTLADDLADLFKVQVKEADAKLATIREQLSRAKEEAGDLGLSGVEVLHPIHQTIDKTHAKLVDVQQRRIQLQSSLLTLQRAIEQGGNLQQHLMALEPTVGREVVRGALGLSAKDAEVVAHLERMLFEEQARLEQVADFYLEEHPEVRRLQSRTVRLREEIANYLGDQEEFRSEEYNDRLGRMLLSLVTEDLQQTWAHEQALRQEFEVAEAEAKQLAGRWRSIRNLEKKEATQENFQQTLITSLNRINTNSGQANVRVRVVSPPVADKRPVTPRLLWVLFVCVASGASVGVGIVYVLDILEDRFRSPEELRDQLRAPVLAMIRNLTATAEEKGVLALQVHNAPDALESEAFRTLRTTVAFAGEEMDCLAVSSSEPGDGKTTVLANFGVALSQAGRRTLMIDADMRRPGLSKMFDVRGHKGLGDLLRGDEEISSLAPQVVLASGAPSLDMIPAGIRPSDPTGLLGGPRFAELISWAQSNYDQILIDTPPILAASDATIIGRMVDGLILVVQPEKNHRRLVHRAAEEIHAANLNFVGVVANRVGDAVGGDYYGTGYGYGYGYGYGHGYGTDEADVAPREDADLPREDADLLSESPGDEAHETLSAVDQTPSPIQPRRAA